MQLAAATYNRCRCGDPGLFRALRMPSIGSERQTESGMFLVDRQRHWLALEWLWLNVNNDVTYKLACEAGGGRWMDGWVGLGWVGWGPPCL